MKVIPDGYRLYHIHKDEFDGIAYIYLMGLPGDVKKFLDRLDAETINRITLKRTKGVPGFD